MLFSLGNPDAARWLMPSPLPLTCQHVPLLSRRHEQGACMKPAAAADGNGMRRSNCAAAVQARPSQCQACITSSHPCQQQSDFPSAMLHEVAQQGWESADFSCTLVWPPAYSYLETKGQQTCAIEQKSDSEQSQEEELGAQVPNLAVTRND